MGMTLRNQSDRELYFCARFAVAPVVGEVWPTLVGPTRDAIPFALRVRLAGLRASDFILLAPGEAILAGFAIRRFFNFAQPGRYELSAKYVSREIPPELTKLPVFVGVVESPVVTFSV